MTVLQSDRRAGLVVEVYQQLATGALGDNPTTFQRVIVPRAVGIFGGADAIGGVSLCPLPAEHFALRVWGSLKV